MRLSFRHWLKFHHWPDWVNLADVSIVCAKCIKSKPRKRPALLVLRPAYRPVGL